MSDDEKIDIEEEEQQEETGGGSGENIWWEEFRVAGEDVLETVKKLAREAGVRRIVVKNRHDRVLLEIPLLLGLTGIVLLPTYAALALVGGLVADCTILVERRAAEGKESAG